MVEIVMLMMKWRVRVECVWVFFIRQKKVHSKCLILVVVRIYHLLPHEFSLLFNRSVFWPLITIELAIERILGNMMRISLHWMSHCLLEHLRGVHVWLGKHAWHQVLSTLHQGSLMAINMGVWVWDLILVVDGSMIWVKLWSVDNRLLLLCLLLL